LIRVAKGRQQANLFKQIGGKKTKRQLLSIPKLEDAHNVGSAASMDCSLILTEGDSAKALAVAGLEIIGRDGFGVFPLRGKLLNVRHAPVDRLANNAEVKAMIAILGLDFDKEYDTVEERSDLRYGHVMLMTDEDTDGSHIKGLVINFFRHFWPKILKPAVDEPLGKPFLSSFVTPLLKATRKTKKETLSFYSMAEYNAWRTSLSNPDELKQWKIKYYKGLGTSTPAEAKEYFKEFDKHHRPFLWNSELDGELLDKVFDKTRAADRRDWISNEYDPEATISFDPDHDNLVTYEDFINKEMIHFSNADNIRSLPSAIDGLKPSQRKVLYACFKRKLKSEVKVAQLSGYCAEHTAYHHGEASLQGTSKLYLSNKVFSKLSLLTASLSRL
jgi:DNA topoisomerase-2